MDVLAYRPTLLSATGLSTSVPPSLETMALEFFKSCFQDNEEAAVKEHERYMHEIRVYLALHYKERF